MIGGQKSRSNKNITSVLKFNFDSLILFPLSLDVFCWYVVVVVVRTEFGECRRILFITLKVTCMSHTPAGLFFPIFQLRSSHGVEKKDGRDICQLQIKKYRPFKEKSKKRKGLEYSMSRNNPPKKTWKKNQLLGVNCKMNGTRRPPSHQFILWSGPFFYFGLAGSCLSMQLLWIH